MMIEETFECAWHRLTSAVWDGETYEVLINKDGQLMLVKMISPGAMRDNGKPAFLHGIPNELFRTLEQLVETSARVVGV